jgi:hypothetical protein
MGTAFAWLLIIFLVLWPLFSLVLPITFYVLGFVALSNNKNRPALARAWIIVFMIFFAYTLYDGAFRAAAFHLRSQKFNDAVVYMAPPAEVRTLQLGRVITDNRPDPRQRPHSCNRICATFLFSGRFDRVFTAFENTTHRRLENRIVLTRKQRIVVPQWAEEKTNYVHIFQLIDQPGCRSPPIANEPVVNAALRLWESVGRCIIATGADEIDGRYFEILSNDKAPDTPTLWETSVHHIRLAGDGGQDIARAESGSADFAFPIPIPGIFNHGVGPLGLPTDFRPGFLWTQNSYGPYKTRYPTLDAVFARAFDIDLNKLIATPGLETIATDAERIAYIRQVLSNGPREAQLHLFNDLASLRPFAPEYRDVLLEYIGSTDTRPQSEILPHLAWLAAGDPDLAPVAAKVMVDTMSRSTRPGSIGGNLSYFQREALEPLAERLISQYDWGGGILNSIIGAAGPLGVPKLIAEIERPDPPDAQMRGAAVGLCRAQDPRAIGPLLKKTQSLEGGIVDFPMSFAYALARLGRGAEARHFLENVHHGYNFGAGPSERACLDEIIDKFPGGDAPASICRFDGPHPKQSTGTRDRSATECLGPQTPPR